MTSMTPDLLSDLQMSPVLNRALGLHMSLDQTSPDRHMSPDLHKGPDTAKHKTPIKCWHDVTQPRSDKDFQLYKTIRS